MITRPVTPAPVPTPEYVTSRDGTRIGYLRQGAGPGVVLVQGAMADVHAYRRLSAALAPWCTVITAERRGRGISPRAFDSQHTIQRDVEDLDAVMGATGATTLFGLSSGAVITLQACRTLPRVQRAVVYEPPFYPAGMDRAALARLFAALDRGDLPSALLDSLLAAGTAPALLARTPRPLARVVAAAVLAADARKRGPASTLRELLPGVRFDFTDVAGADGHIGDCAAITIPVLLLSGARSPPFLRQATRTLRELIPASRHHEFPRLGHDGPWNAGDPTSVAAAIREFLKESF